MLSLALAGATFLVLHLLISGTVVRGAVVSTIGEGPYLGLYSLASIAALVWMAVAYGAVDPSDRILLWAPSPAWVWAGTPINLVALVLIVLGLVTPNPTLVQMEFLLEQGDPAKGIIRITRHPMLIGIFIWSLYHCTVNGDVASQIFFGTFAITTAVGPFSIDAKRKKKMGDLWAPFAEKTSIVPFLAIAQGRNHLALGEIGAARGALAGIAFAAFWYFHPWLFGVAAYPG